MELQGSPTWADRPLGMRDVYPQHARRRRELENRLLEFFEQQGFEMVSCGVFEYVDTLLRGRSREETATWVQLFDTTGRAMALRPDITPSIARMGAPLLRGERNEIKWCYSEKVYRRAQQSSSFTWSGTRAAESTQVGVEWLGTCDTGVPEYADGEQSQSTHVDANLLGVCVEALRYLQLSNWQLVVGHAAFTPAFLRAMGVSDQHLDDLLLYLAEGNYVGFQQASTSLLADTSAVAEMSDVSGRSEASVVLTELSKLNPYDKASFSPEIRSQFGSSANGRQALLAWEYLTRLAKQIEVQGMADRITFDLTLCRDLTYYTGIVFEVFAEGVGAPIALGGRYDDLLQHFGSVAPAIGFTFEVEGVMNAVVNEGEVSS